MSRWQTLFGITHKPSLSQKLAPAQAQNNLQYGAQNNPYMNVTAQHRASIQQNYQQTLNSAYKPEPRPQWMWAGRVVSITEFAELAYGDTAQRTIFLLKYSDK